MKNLELKKEDALSLYKIMAAGPGGRGHSVKTMDLVRRILDGLETGASNFEPNKSIEFKSAVTIEITDAERTTIKDYWENHVGWSGVKRDEVYNFLKQLDDLPEIKEEEKKGQVA